MMLQHKLPALDDAEGAAVPIEFPPVIDAHVQCFDMNSKEMELIYQICSTEQKPLLMHVGREPKSPAYACDPFLLCRADKLERVINHFPELNESGAGYVRIRFPQYPFFLGP